MTYGDSVIPPVDGDCEDNVARKYIILDCCRTVKRRRIIVRPNRGANADAKIKEFLADDFVVGYDHIRIAAMVLLVHHVDGAEPTLCRRGLDGISGDCTSRGTKDHNTAVGWTGDLLIKEISKDIELK